MKEEFRMEQKGMLIIMAKVAPEKEEAFNRWYNEEHLPRALERLPGAISGRRYKILEGEQEYQFLALYEFESYQSLDSALKSDAMKQLVEEYNEAFGEGGRKRLKAIQIKSLAVG
jgi:antibiotic biosynthesis monooxygenase (ABM) superfamily enzyme